MGTLVDIVGNEEAVVDCIISHEAADPVVYQLARVDGDGRLVPATEDDVMAVEDLLEDEKSNVRTLDTGQILECSTNGSEGQPQLEVLEIGTEKPNIPPHPTMDSEEVDFQPKERIPSLVRHASDGSVCQSGSPGECSKTFSELDRSKTNSAFDTGLKPDFSLLNGEIHLDNLSVKDLQETFKATFGRETSVKDKQWLKRRIIMGLTNSFTSEMENQESPSTSHDKQSEIHSIANETNMESSTFQDKCGPKDAETEERPPSAKVWARPVQNFGLDRRYLTRKDSLGGSGIQIPYVSRIRRSRPRENLTNLVKLQPSGRASQPVWKRMILHPTHNLTMNAGIMHPKTACLPDGLKSLWSEIKRVAFASYSYRTSVDLKDKWRNLLRASLAELPTGNGMHGSRKQASVPIPAPILSRVRELAEIQTHVPPSVSYCKLAERKMGIIEKIKEIEAEMARTQKNKATEYHLGQLKAKIAKLRTQLLEPPKGSSGAGEGFEVTKFGHGRVALIGFPSVGKSTLLTMLTGTHSEAASYEFTTLTCIPGIIHYNDTKIQLLDLPGIIEGASEGKGRGRQVIAVAKSADLVLMVLDASKSEGHRQILTRELEAVGLRLNKRPPQIYFKKKKTGGISFNSTLPLTHVDEKLCYQILHEYKIHNAEVLFREDATVDDLIDVIEGNRKYMKCVYVYNKIDVIGIDDVDRLARQPNSIVISCNLKLNLDRLLARMWEEMGLVRIYTKPQGQQPDFSDPVVLSSCEALPQHCGLSHTLQDEDVVQIVKKKEREDGGRGRFKSHSNTPARISDREKKAPLKT
ncbi:UNVERIFIED_CONTAM: Developmentally-regulated G-protein 2 [Sesamum angustifolium]|uniref:Developmentally-regulated G-protein 2 n=1 Tax=Sesamum angustifolium TaxID=2727405 RepID=A0AAW2RKJ0_9LAMI